MYEKWDIFAPYFSRRREATRRARNFCRRSDLLEYCRKYRRRETIRPRDGLCASTVVGGTADAIHTTRSARRASCACYGRRYRRRDLYGRATVFARPLCGRRYRRDLNFLKTLFVRLWSLLNECSFRRRPTDCRDSDLVTYRSLWRQCSGNLSKKICYKSDSWKKISENSTLRMFSYS